MIDDNKMCLYNWIDREINRVIIYLILNTKILFINSYNLKTGINRIFSHSNIFEA